MRACARRTRRSLTAAGAWQYSQVPNAYLDAQSPVAPALVAGAAAPAAAAAACVRGVVAKRSAGWARSAVATWRWRREERRRRRRVAVGCAVDIDDTDDSDDDGDDDSDDDSDDGGVERIGECGANCTGRRCAAVDDDNDDADGADNSRL